MKRTAFAMGAAMLLLGLMPGSTLALGPSNLDQSNAVVSSNYLVTTDILAQTFTAGSTGMLSAVDLWIGGSETTASIAASITATTALGLPSGAALASATANSGGADGWVHFSFSKPSPVTSGTQYAIVFVAAAPLPAVYGSAGDYPRGQALRYGAGGVPNLIEGIPDFAFQTYVDTVTTVSQWDKPSVVAGATTPLTLTVTMTFHNGVEAKTYGVQVGGWPSWYTPQSSTCSSLQGADPAPVCTLKDLQINTLYVNAPATGDTLTVIVTGTAAPTQYDVGYPGVASGHAWMHYNPETVFLEAVGDATVQVVAPAATAPPATAPPATAAPTLPPTSAGVGSGSDGTGSTIWLLPIGLLAFLGGAFALVIRRRRLA